MILSYKGASAPLLVLLLASAPLSGAASRTITTRHTRSHHPSTTAAHRRHSSSKSKTSKAGRKSRKPNAYQRLAKMQMDPGRVESIQKALGDAGAYHGNPTGQWDSDTREAMARYQAQNGFGVTGLPDAKSLMKLGLGPHPLPAELDKKRAANIQPSSPAVGEEPSPSAAGGPSSTPGSAAEPSPPQEK